MKGEGRGMVGGRGGGKGEGGFLVVLRVAKQGTQDKFAAKVIPNLLVEDLEVFSKT